MGIFEVKGRGFLVSSRDWLVGVKDEFRRFD